MASVDASATPPVTEVWWAHDDGQDTGGGGITSATPTPTSSEDFVLIITAPKQTPAPTPTPDQLDFTPSNLTLEDQASSTIVTTPRPAQVSTSSPPTRQPSVPTTPSRNGSSVTSSSTIADSGTSGVLVALLVAGIAAIVFLSAVAIVMEVKRRRARLADAEIQSEFIYDICEDHYEWDDRRTWRVSSDDVTARAYL